MTTCAMNVKAPATVIVWYKAPATRLDSALDLSLDKNRVKNRIVWPGLSFEFFDIFYDMTTCAMNVKAPATVIV